MVIFSSQNTGMKSWETVFTRNYKDVVKAKSIRSHKVTRWLQTNKNSPCQFPLFLLFSFVPVNHKIVRWMIWWKLENFLVSSIEVPERYCYWNCFPTEIYLSSNTTLDCLTMTNALIKSSTCTFLYNLI